MASKPSEKKSKTRAPSRRGSEIKPSPKKPNYVDEHVAKRLRLRRNLLGLSQDELARRLDLTPQLIQKYETSETRISASRLYSIAAQLAVPITWFFEELKDRRQNSAPASRAEVQDWSELVTKRESRQLLELYFAIPDERLRRKVMEVAQLLKANGAE
jgi:transcriptional regulator with XRE-family HTH domain